MTSLARLWLPIVLSAVAVFIASSILHMLLRFWHGSDARGFANENEVAAAIRKGAPAAGLYMIPYCTPEAMKDPAMQDRFRQGPVGVMFLRRSGTMNMGACLAQWFGFCLLVSIACALLAAPVLGPGASSGRVFHSTGLAALLGHAFGALPDAIWWGHPWRSALKHIADGIIYAVITGALFACLWPV